jgi:hypothetical protein
LDIFLSSYLEHSRSLTASNTCKTKSRTTGFRAALRNSMPPRSWNKMIGPSSQHPSSSPSVVILLLRLAHKTGSFLVRIGTCCRSSQQVCDPLQ